MIIRVGFPFTLITRGKLMSRKSMILLLTKYDGAK